jgi:hypothetical protein
MIPTLSLGPWDSPAFEILNSSLNPIVAILVEQSPPMNADERDALMSFLQLDTIFLDSRTESLFRRLERTCRSIASGEVSGYGVEAIQASEFADYLRRMPWTGRVTQDVVDAAQGFLDFLAGHPGHWPLR